MKKRLIQAGLGVAAAAILMTSTGCVERVSDEGSELRNSLVQICVDHGCDPMEKVEKIQPFMDRYDEEFQAMHDARGFGRSAFMGGATSDNNLLRGDRTRLQNNIRADFLELH
ncbi:MAG: hypothetical protein FWE31_04955 [Firmicutes bacterium]|nr:hypothetical protein [Bacillota bacterium]